MMNDQLMNVFRGMTLAGKAAVAIATLALVVAIWSSAGMVGAFMRPALEVLTVPPPMKS